MRASNCPPGASSLDNRSFAVQPHVADLRLARGRAVVDMAVFDQAPADAAAESDVKDRVETQARPVAGFPQGGNVGVVVHGHRHAGQLAQPGAEVKLRPPFDLVRAADLARFPIHRPAKAHTDCLDWPKAHQLGQAPPNLAANPFSAGGGLDLELAPLDDLPRLVAQDQLELGAADFDANE